MRILAMWFLMFLGSCLSGCQIGLLPAEKLFGDAAKSPKLIVKKTLCGFYAEAGTDFSGKLIAHYNPETKAFDLDGTVSSDAGSVLARYPEWIGGMADIRKAEIAANIEINRIQAVKFQAAADTARALGEAGIGVVGQMVGMIGGSKVDVTTPWGGASGVLGPAPPPVPVPVTP